MTISLEFPSTNKTDRQWVRHFLKWRSAWLFPTSTPFIRIWMRITRQVSPLNPGYLMFTSQWHQTEDWEEDEKEEEKEEGKRLDIKKWYLTDVMSWQETRKCVTESLIDIIVTVLLSHYGDHHHHYHHHEAASQTADKKQGQLKETE